MEPTQKERCAVRNRRMSVLVALALAPLVACADVDSNDDPPVDVAGTWNLTDTVGQNNCGDSGSSSYSVEVTQNENALTVSTPVGVFSGAINGNTVQWTGSFPEDGGTTTINSMTLTVSADGNSLSGSSNWSWTDGSESCSGTTNTTGTRASSPSSPSPTPSMPSGTPTGECIPQTELCSAANTNCCTGGVCVIFEEFTACAGECNVGADCVSDCCIDLDGGGRACAPSTYCAAP